MPQEIDKSKYTILIVDDDEDARLVLKMMVQRDGYQVFEAEDGLQALVRFDEVRPDVVLMDAMMPNMDGFTAAEKILEIPEGKDVPIVMVTALNDDASIQRAFQIGASDYITKPVQVSVMRHRIERLVRTRAAEEELRRIIQDQRFLSRLDRDLGYTLDRQRVLNLAMDVVLRRTGGSSVVVGLLNPSTRRLEKIASIGGSSILNTPIRESELLEGKHEYSPAFGQTGQVVKLTEDDDYIQLVIPLVVEANQEGIIIVDHVMERFLNDSDLQFLQQVGNRAAVTLDKARLYERSKAYNEKLDFLHHISTAISSSLNRADMVEMSTRGLPVLIEGTSAFYCAYDRRRQALEVEANFVVVGMSDKPPEIGTTFDMRNDDFMQYVQERVIPFRLSDPKSPARLRAFAETYGFKSGLVLPLVIEMNLFAIIVMGESRSDRVFSPDELALARSMGDHFTVMIQQSELFNEVKALEEVKSEMINMASHDLKNPLLQVKGYLDLLLKTLDVKLTEQQNEFVHRIQAGITRMNTLLEDILNLERIESHATTQLDNVNLRLTLYEVAEAQRYQAELKNQNFSIELDSTDAFLQGNEVQLQQAFTNFVNNAVKYTPEGGDVYVRSRLEDGEFHFEVQDSGFGIPKDRQDKLFERFYRARTPGTEDIPGTGLGLSLVKSVIERHGGGVWFRSEEGNGSTFGGWLPVDKTANGSSNG